MKIIVKNKYCEIITQNKDVLKKIKKLLSYKQPGAEYTPAYKNGWDGMISLISNRNEFGTGLLNKVVTYLNNENIDFVIEDNRNLFDLNNEIDITKKCAELNLIPRDYQIRALNAAIDNNMGIIRGATGSGKTFLAAMMAAKFNKPTIIYVIGLDLLQQFYDLFSQIFDEKIGWIGNGICDIQKITIASVWSLGAALELKNNILIDDDNVEEEVSPSRRDKAKILSYLSEAKIHIIDECHACTCETLQSIHKYINPERIYGLSGTPYRDDGSDLLINSMLGEIIENISASELIAKGVLAQPIIKFINVPFQPHNSSVYKQVYKEYIVDNEIRNQIIVDQTKKLIDKGYKPLVLFQTINHGKYLFEEFKKANIRCDLLHGNDSLDKRNEIKKKLDDDEIDCIIASTIFDIGLNLPKLSGLVLAGGGKSKVRILQRIGRVIRMIDGKSKAAIVDFMDNARYLDKHSKIRYETYLSEPGFKILGQ